MRCTVYWHAYKSKPTSTPKADDLDNVESMRISASTTISTTFEKAHAGVTGGTYIYYYMKCYNSKYSCQTPVTYTIIPR